MPSMSSPFRRIEPLEDLRVAREVAHDREGGRRLPAARLPDEPVRLSLPDLERDAAQHGPVDTAHGVRDLQVLELNGGVGHLSKSCATASAIRLMPTMSVAMAREGKRTGHQ